VSKQKFLFVPPGSLAPDPLPRQEVWVDVGSRAEPPVFDHHAGGAESTAALVRRHRIWLREKTFTRIVTHSAPDVDALTAIWLIRDEGVGSDDTTVDQRMIDQLVDLVTRHDRGDEPIVPPTRDWGTLFAEYLTGLDDEKRVLAGLKVLDLTYGLMAERGANNLEVEDVFPAWLIQRADGAERHFNDDWQRARQYRMSLGDATDQVRAVHITDPVCPLFHPFLRWQSRQRLIHADVCVVSTKVQADGFPAPLWRHIISVPRNAGLNLAGFGHALEQTERCKEDQLEGPFVPERRRLTPGKGRFGSGVLSPWYDGRGHGQTIIDTPCFIWRGKTVCGSLQTPEEIAKVLAGEPIEADPVFAVDTEQ
jgi:hypothetical protein